MAVLVCSDVWNVGRISHIITVWCTLPKESNDPSTLRTEMLDTYIL
jgi:hypothetical protein